MTQDDISRYSTNAAANQPDRIKWNPLSPENATIIQRKVGPTKNELASLEALLAHERETNEALRAQLHAVQTENVALKANTRQIGPDLREVLSPREYEVLALLAQGLLYKECADRLGISFETTHTYCSRLYQKLGVQSRTQAVVKFLQAKG